MIVRISGGNIELDGYRWGIVLVKEGPSVSFGRVDHVKHSGEQLLIYCHWMATWQEDHGRWERDANLNRSPVQGVLSAWTIQHDGSLYFVAPTTGGPLALTLCKPGTHELENEQVYDPEDTVDPHPDE